MNKTRSGFTLVELLVVITIIGILMGLLIPAVNAAREAGRKAQCSANIRNFGLASIQYENSKGRLPSWCKDFGSYKAPSSGLADPSDPDSAVTAPDHQKVGTWTVALLPYLDAQATYELWTEDKYPVVSSGSSANPASNDGYTVSAAPNLEIMQCPSSPTLDATHGKNSYVSNNGMHDRDVTGNRINDGTRDISFAISMEKANGALVNGFAGKSGVAVGAGVTLDDLKDGQGYTVLFSENLQAMPWHRAGLSTRATLSAADVNYPSMARFTQGMVWHWADPSQLNSVSNPTPSQTVMDTWRINGSAGTQDKFNVSMRQTNTVANLVYNANLARPSSAHVDGVNMSFADASVKFISDSIDYRVYQALMTPRGKSSNVPYNEYILQTESL